MTLEEIKQQISRLFADKVTELTWSTPVDILSRIIGDFEVERQRIVGLAEEISVSQLTPDQVTERFDNLIQQTIETIEIIATQESPLDLTTDSGISGDEAPVLLRDVEETIHNNINHRIAVIIRGAIGEEPTPMLIEMLDPGYLARFHPDVENDSAVTDEILTNFSEHLDDIREQVNNLIVFRGNLISQARNADDQACMDITGTINAIVDDMEVSTPERSQRIREILLKVANNNVGAVDHAIEVGVRETDITRLQLAANEYGQTRQAELSGIINDSREEITYPPLLIRHPVARPNPEGILEELYQYIVEQSLSNPVSPMREGEVNEEGAAIETVFEGLDTLDLSTEEINGQIHAYLGQVLLGEEGASADYIISYVTNIVGRIDDADSRLGQAHAAIQELIETLSVQYDVFEGAVYNILPSGTPPFEEEDSSLVVTRMREDEGDDIGTELDNSHNTRRDNTPVPDGVVMGDVEHTEIDDDQEQINGDTNYTFPPPPPPPTRDDSNATWSRSTTPDLTAPQGAGELPGVMMSFYGGEGASQL